MSSFWGRACACAIVLCLIVFISARINHALRAENMNARQRGATVFQAKNCERCHAIFGTGGDRAPDLAAVGSRKTASQIKEQVVNGGHGMPPFGRVLSKDEVKDVVAFLTSCKTETAPGCRQWMQSETEPGQSQ